MNQTKHLRAACGRCGGAIRCPADLIGTQTQCPHCGQQAELLLAVPTEESSAPRKLVVWSVIAIVMLLLGLAACLLALRWAEQRRHHRTQPTATTPLNETPAQPTSGK